MKNIYILTRLLSDDDDVPFEKRNPGKNPRHPDGKNENGKNYRIIYDTQNFKCRQCGFFVTASREISGVNNRNHCPRCLWSRHMDMNTPGDRRSECLSRMEPVGLTIKQVNKRYGDNQGELMLVHICTGCGKISINRIAGDDDTETIYDVYKASCELSTSPKNLPDLKEIRVIGKNDLHIVRTQLFGVRGEMEGMQHVGLLDEMPSK